MSDSQMTFILANAWLACGLYFQRWQLLCFGMATAFLIGDFILQRHA